MKFLVSLSVFIFIICSSSFAQIEIFSAKMQKALDANDYEHALEYSSKVLAEDSLNFKAYFCRGLACFYLDRTDSSLADYNKALSLDPKKDYVYHYRGMTYLQAKLYLEAIQDFDRAIASNPKNYDALTYKGNAFLGLDKPQEAIEYYKKSIKVNPKQNYAFFQRGNAQLMLKNFELAIKDFNSAEKNGFKTNKLYFGRANAYYQQFNYKIAIEDFTSAIACDSNDVESYNNRAICYSKIGEPDKSVKDKQKKYELMQQGFLPSFENIKFKTFHDEKNIFSFDLPDTWNIVSLTDSANSQISVTMEKVNSVEDYYKVGVTAGFETNFKEKYGASTPQEILTFWKNNSLENSKNYAQYDLISTKQKKYNGYESCLNDIIVQADNKSQMMYLQEFLIPFEGSVLYIFFQSPIEDSPFFNKIYETTLRSLKFTPPSKSN